MPTRTKDTPDAHVWAHGGTSRYLCLRCLHDERPAVKDVRNGTYRAVIAHLWRTHGLRRVWITEEVPNLEHVRQLAFDAAVGHNTQFRNGDVRT